MAAVTVCSDFGAQEIKSVTASNFASIYHEMLSLDAVILVLLFFFLCWVPSHSPLSPSSRLLPLHLLPLHWHHLHIQGGYFSQESWSNLWFFQPGIFHDVLCMQVKYTANLEPVVCSMSCSNCCYWLAHRFIRRQVRRSGTPVSWRIFQFVVIHTFKGIVNEAEVDIFLEFPWSIHDSMMVGNLISGFSAFLNSACIFWRFWFTY